MASVLEIAKKLNIEDKEMTSPFILEKDGRTYKIGLQI